MKQMKIIHQDGFKEQKLSEYQPIMYKNILESAQQVVIYMKKIGLEHKEYSNRVHYHNLYQCMHCILTSLLHKALAEKVLEFKLDMSNTLSTSPLRLQK